jgi:hypothetical protein
MDILKKLVDNGDIVSYKNLYEYVEDDYNEWKKEYYILTFKSGISLRVISGSVDEENCIRNLNIYEMDELEKTIHDYDSSFPYVELAMYLHNNKEKCRRHHDLTRLIYGFICDYSNNPLSDSWNLADRILYLDL